MAATDIQTLRSGLRGELIQAGDDGYDVARKVYNGMIDRRPRYIAMCRDVADVMACVNFSRENQLLLAVRGGGHNGGGLGVCDDGFVLDLSRMKGIRVDPAERTVRVEGGCTWKDVDHATFAFRMATPSGIISTTGVGGLTLGGGIGHLTRKYGLTIDNLVSADMVLADGRFVTVSADQNADLFWAIRGGGGNFGVVTSFVFRLHPAGMVHAGPMLWPMDRAADVLGFYADFIRRAPEELSGFFAFLQVPPGPPFPENLHLKTMCGIVWCHLGPEGREQELLKPVRDFARPAFEFIGTMPHPVLQSFFDPIYPPGLQWYWRADFVKEIPAKAIQKHVEFGGAIPTMHSTMHLYPVDGAVHRVGSADTAFSYRDVNWTQVIVGVDPNPANADRITKWTKDYFEALHPFSAGGAYVNFMMNEGEDRIRATYRDNYSRLAAVKGKYDADNLFRVNQNIRPAAKGAGA